MLTRQCILKARAIVVDGIMLLASSVCGITAKRVGSLFAMPLMASRRLGGNIPMEY